MSSEKYATGFQVEVANQGTFFFFQLKDWLAFLQLYPDFTKEAMIFTPVVANRENLEVVTVGVFKVLEPASNTFVSNFI